MGRWSDQPQVERRFPSLSSDFEHVVLARINAAGFQPIRPRSEPWTNFFNSGVEGALRMAGFFTFQFWAAAN